METVMMDFSETDTDTLRIIVGRYRIHLTLCNRIDKFCIVGRPNKFQELERKGIVYTSHQGDRIKQKYYWWYLTDTGLDIIKTMVAMGDL